MTCPDCGSTDFDGDLRVCLDCGRYMVIYDCGEGDIPYAFD